MGIILLELYTTFLLLHNNWENVMDLNTTVLHSLQDYQKRLRIVTYDTSHCDASNRAYVSWANTLWNPLVSDALANDYSLRKRIACSHHCTLLFDVSVDPLIRPPEIFTILLST